MHRRAPHTALGAGLPPLLFPSQVRLPSSYDHNLSAWLTCSPRQLHTRQRTDRHPIEHCPTARRENPGMGQPDLSRSYHGADLRFLGLPVLIPSPQLSPWLFHPNRMQDLRLLRRLGVPTDGVHVPRHQQAWWATSLARPRIRQARLAQGRTGQNPSFGRAWVRQDCYW